MANVTPMKRNLNRPKYALSSHELTMDKQDIR